MLLKNRLKEKICKAIIKKTKIIINLLLENWKKNIEDFQDY